MERGRKRKLLFRPRSVFGGYFVLRGKEPKSFFWGEGKPLISAVDARSFLRRNGHGLRPPFGRCWRERCFPSPARFYLENETLRQHRRFSSATVPRKHRNGNKFSFYHAEISDKNPRKRRTLSGICCSWHRFQAELCRNSAEFKESVFWGEQACFTGEHPPETWPKKRPRDRDFMSPGDGGRRESACAAVLPDSSDKSALGEGWGLGGGEPPCAPAKGVPLPQKHKESR